MENESIGSYIQEIERNSNEINYQVSSFLGTINKNISNMNKNLAKIENQYVNPTDVESGILNIEGSKNLGNLITFIKAIGGFFQTLGALGLIALAKWLIGKKNENNGTIKCECHCECHCDCCGGDGGDEPGGEPVKQGETETEGENVIHLDQYRNATKNFDSSIVETNDDIIALSNNFVRATEVMNSTAMNTFPQMASVMKNSLLASLILIAAQSLKTEKITNGAFDGIASAAKLSNGSLLADATLTYGKWLMDIKTFFEKRLGLYSKNEKAINGTVSNEGKALNKLNQENLLKSNGITSEGLAMNLGFYSKIGSEIFNLLKFNGEKINNNNKSNLGQYNRQTSEYLNQELALYKRLENELNQLQKTSSTKINNTHNEGLISYLEETKEHLLEELYYWDLHGKHVISSNQNITTSINGIHRNGLLSYVEDLINPFAEVERLWNMHGEHVLNSNQNTMTSINSNTLTGLNTLETIVGNNGQSIENIVNNTGNNSTEKIYGTVNNINNSLINAGPTWYSSIKSSLSGVLSAIGSFVTDAKNEFHRLENWRSRAKNYINSLNSSVWENGESELGDPIGDSVGAFAIRRINSTWDTSRLSDSNFNSSGFTLDRSGDVNVVINSPKALNPFEVRRQMEKMSRNMANGFY